MISESMQVILIGTLAGSLVAFLVGRRLMTGGSIPLPILVGAPILLLAVSAFSCWIPAAGQRESTRLPRSDVSDGAAKPRVTMGRRCRMRSVVMLLLLLAPARLGAQRVVEGNRLISTELPNTVLEVAPGLVYAGTQTFDLYGVANAEQHFFVDLDGTRIKRLLWVQYEGYHASNTNTYNYRDETVAHSGRTWRRRISAAQVPATEARPDSDGARMRAFLRGKGWRMGPNITSERLVWLLDTPPRNELMIIYMEDGTHQDHEAFHRRAVGAFTVRNR